jgi:predicted metalloprotease with PDZ domain
MKRFKLYVLLTFTFSLLIASVSSAFGQNPLKNHTDAVDIRYSSLQPVISYTLIVTETDISTYEVQMRIRNVPDTFHIAMMTHPEYDDRFWRYVKDLRVETKKGNGNVLREDSALWLVVAHGNDLMLHYSIHLPTQTESLRPAWRPFLHPTGGLVGGPQSFMYIVGATLAPSFLSLQLPKDWMIATGLQATADPFTFFAPSAASLFDAPILIGSFKTWQFAVDQVPHRVCYWSLPNAAPFDTITLVNYIQRFVQQCITLFGRLPYREYSFLLQDGAYGALEHGNSVTIGLPSAQISKDIASYFGIISHEYFHTWNLMRIRPIEFGDISYKTPALSRGLWWSEGLTIFYSDLLRRRASVPTIDSTRIKHLEELMSRYFSSPGNMYISPERVSLAADGPPGMLGDFTASTHLQGELLGTMMDLIIRSATNGKYSIDDVMRKMMEKYSGWKGFTNRNIEEIVATICGCDVHLFFKNYVYGSRPIDFNQYLYLAGMRENTKWSNALDSLGKPVPDLRVYAFQTPGNTVLQLGITDPNSCWGKAGLHTKDIILTVNQSAIKNANDFRQLIRRLQVGDSVFLEVQRLTGILHLQVIVSGFRQPVTKINTLDEISEKQRNLRNAWMLSL